MLNALIAEFLQHLKYERNLSPHTQRNYHSDLEQFRTWILSIENREDIEADAIDRLTIREWLATLHRDHKKTSIARKLSSLRTFFQFLVREGRIAANPAKLVSTPRIERKLPAHLSMEDAVRFIEMPNLATDLGRRDRAILEMLYATGIRVSELVGIDVSDVDVTERLVRVLGKRRKERIVPFGEPALAALLLYVNETRPQFIAAAKGAARGEKALFLHRRGGRLTTRSVGRLVEKYIRECSGMFNISPHACGIHSQHTCSITAPTFATFRNFSATHAFHRRRSIPTFRWKN
ncbi:MAG: site-specific recombinase XerD [Acidobacteria bacterium OLB17]|nr:MAG: site-specific recombinase XerD [Acidobacteria bacterium OLB17]